MLLRISIGRENGGKTEAKRNGGKILIPSTNLKCVEKKEQCGGHTLVLFQLLP
jgi:hypothetical protein